MNLEKKWDSLRNIVPNVSRETFDKLCTYEKLIIEGAASFNLVSPSTLSHVWERHILDSAQLWRVFEITSLQAEGSTLDLGSGAGFPGMVLAILGVPSMTLLDSTRKKCLFLENVSRETQTPVRVVWGRVENLSEKFDRVTCRAVASIEALCAYFDSVLIKSGAAYLLKGEKVKEEISLALKKWDFTYVLQNSMTHNDGKICVITNLKNKKTCATGGSKG